MTYDESPEYESSPYRIKLFKEPCRQDRDQWIGSFEPSWNGPQLELDPASWRREPEKRRAGRKQP
jgi:hypothetical protein